MKKYYWIKLFEAADWEVARLDESTNIFHRTNGERVNFDGCFSVHFEEIVPPK